jgi:hypothetical protein
MNTSETKMTAAERQRMWDDAERDESTLNNSAPQLPNASAIDGLKSEPAANEPVEKTGQEADAGALTPQFAGIPQEFLDTMAGMQSTIAQLQTRLRGAEGHIGGIKSSLKAAREAAQTSADAGNAAPTEAQIQAAHAGGSKAMAALKEKYPEFGADLEAVLSEQMSSQREATQKPAAQVEARTGYTEADIALARRDAFIEASHEGWQDLIETPEFVGWYQRQPDEVKRLGADPSPAAGVKLIDAFKARHGKQPDPQDRLSAFGGMSAASRTHRGGFSTNRGVDQMSREEYWAHLEAQDKQT